jgi:hypothetical protein
MSKRLFAGKIPGTSTYVTSIYSGTDDNPLSNPTAYLDRLYFDTRLDYMHLVRTIDISVAFPGEGVTTDCGKKGKNCADIPRQGTRDYDLGAHGQSYTPTCLIYDRDNGRAITGTMFIQTVSNNSFRLCSLRVSTSRIYIKEKWFVRSNNLDATNRNFRVFVFNKPAI